MSFRHNASIRNGSLQSPMERRSEEVTDIIERMPTGWTRLVVAIITMIVVVMLSLGFVIKYPDTVEGQISITGEKAPVRLVASTSGRLQLLVDDNAEVQAGTYIGYIETGAVYEDILRLDSICNVTFTMDTRMELPERLELGALSAHYNDFVLAYTRYVQFRETKVYDNMRKALRHQQQSDRQIAENLQKEISLSSAILSNLREQYEADSILYDSGAISGESLAQQNNSILSHQQSNIEMRSSELMKQSDINSADIELAKVDIDVMEERSSLFNSMMAKYNILVSQMRQWKEQYLFVAPISGSLQYLGFWRDNVHVDALTEVVSISPTRNRMVGELLIPSFGAGKVEVGQDVNVKLADYPYDEYGYVCGKVEHISSLTCNVKSAGGNATSYLVTVSFPNGLKTNFGKELRLNYESTGRADIITEKRRLIGRLFDNLKANTEK